MGRPLHPILITLPIGLFVGTFIFDLVFWQGARANGLERKIGTLTPGKDADIILLRTDQLNVKPMNNAVGAVVTSMGPQNVDTVLTRGTHECFDQGRSVLQADRWLG